LRCGPWSWSWCRRCATWGSGSSPTARCTPGCSPACSRPPPRGRVPDESQRQRVEGVRDQLTAYEALCRELGAEPAHVALAWLLHNPVVSAAIVGASSVEELRDDLRVLSVQPDTSAVQRLGEIWPGPGEAPQAYAW
jgi:aryl-alcohol dehydrogenase-like predicted oxidoreductase